MTKDELIAKAGAAHEFSHDLRVVPLDYALQAVATIATTANPRVITRQMVRAGIDALVSRGHELPFDESALEEIVVEVFDAMDANPG